MTDVIDGETPDGTPDDGSDENLVRPVYVYTGPKIIADSKIRLAEWLERRGW